MNISLTENELSSQANIRAMEGILFIKHDKAGAAEIIGRLDQLLKYYPQALEQAKEKLNKDFEMKNRMGRQQGAGGGSAQGFREEWNSVIGQLNDMAEMNLSELKEILKKSISVKGTIMVIY